MSTKQNTFARELPAIRRGIVVALIVIATPPLLAISELKSLGWILLSLAAVWPALYYKTRFGKHMLLLIGMLVLLGLVPIDTTVAYTHMLVMGGVLALTVAVPYFFTNNWLKEKVITFPFAPAVAGTGRRLHTFYLPAQLLTS